MSEQFVLHSLRCTYGTRLIEAGADAFTMMRLMEPGDNQPVGILLCTQKDHAIVEYALAGMTNNLFVSKYQLELPKKAEMQSFLERKLREAGNYSKPCCTLNAEQEDNDNPPGPNR